MHDVGVIVGRFQIDELHEGHEHLLHTVMGMFNKVIVFIGVAPVPNEKNPLDFDSRRHLFGKWAHRLIILPIEDRESDVVWSADLDRAIESVIKPGQTVKLFGGRDSFIERYHGRFEVQKIQDHYHGPSSTDVRSLLRNRIKPCKNFRSGVIWGQTNRYPAPIPTVDVAVWRFDDGIHMLLLGQKKDSDEWRLIGGFASPGSHSYEDDARRELREEAGFIEVSALRYVGSYKVDDWRYAGDANQIKTVLFECDHLHGVIRAGDDIASVGWFDIRNLPKIAPNHAKMIEGLVNAKHR